MLIEVKFDFVSQHLSDGSDRLAGTMSEDIAVSPAFCHFLITVSFKGGIVFYCIVSRVDQSISENTGATLRLKQSSLNDQDKADFLRLCPCLYYTVSGHVKGNCLSALRDHHRIGIRESHLQLFLQFLCRNGFFQQFCR